MKRFLALAAVIGLLTFSAVSAQTGGVTVPTYDEFATLEGRVAALENGLEDHRLQLDDHEARITALETEPEPEPSPSPEPEPETAQEIRDAAAPQPVTRPAGAADKSPGTLTQTYLDSQGAGAKIWLLAGTHTVSGSLAPLQGQTIAASSDGSTVITGASDNSRIIAITTPDVQILGGTYTGFGGPNNTQGTAHSAIFAGPNWLIQDATFDDNYNRGVSFSGIGSTARRSVFTNNGRYGFAGPSWQESNHGTLIVNCEVAFNNDPARGLNPGGDAGAMKFSGRPDANSTIRNSWFHDNYGFGIWYDNGTERDAPANVLIENNVSENNLRAGIFYERSAGGTVIRRNFLSGNGYGNSTWPQTVFHGWQILVSGGDALQAGPDEEIEITENIVDGTDADGTPPPHPFLMGLLSHHNQSPTVRGVNVHHNKFIVRGTGQAVGGVDTDVVKTMWTDDSNTIDHNEYLVLDLNAKNWRWDEGNGQGKAKTWAEWQSFGFDVNSTREVIP